MTNLLSFGVIWVITVRCIAAYRLDVRLLRGADGVQLYRWVEVLFIGQDPESCRSVSRTLRCWTDEPWGLAYSPFVKVLAQEWTVAYRWKSAVQYSIYV